MVIVREEEVFVRAEVLAALALAIVVAIAEGGEGSIVVATAEAQATNNASSYRCVRSSSLSQGRAQDYE